MKGIDTKAPPVDGVKYYNLDVRHELRTGDVLLFRGDRSLSRLIEAVEGGTYSHAAFVIRWKHRVMVAQAEWPRLEAIPASRAITEYKGQVDWYRIRKERREQLDRERLIDVAMDLLGTTFALTDLIKVGFYNCLGQPVPIEPEEEKTKDFFCSEYVAHCFRQAGLPLVHHDNHIAVSPDDVARSEVLEGITSIHWDPENRAGALALDTPDDDGQRRSRVTAA